MSPKLFIDIMEDYKRYTETTKQCSKCKTFKPFSDFNKCKQALLGLHNHCRECQRLCKKKWYGKNREESLIYAKEYSKSEKAISNRKERWKRLKHILGPISNARRRTESAKIKARIQRKKWMSIPHNKIAQSLRGRIRQAMRGIVKSIKTEELTGCSFETLKQHLESKFKDGMSWDNYGRWEIDHVLPCASFDLSKEEDQKKCFHYTNLQPLWAEDNHSKGSKIL